MKSFKSLALLAVTAAPLFAFAGCKDKTADKPKTPAAPSVSTADPVNADMARLAKGDYDAAVAQRICPVTEEALGSMGTPIKVTLEGGRDVFLCCEGCRDAILAEPAKYLAILDAAKAAPAASAEVEGEKAAN